MGVFFQPFRDISQPQFSPFDYFRLTILVGSTDLQASLNSNCQLWISREWKILSLTDVVQGVLFMPLHDYQAVALRGTHFADLGRLVRTCGFFSTQPCV